MRRMDGYRRGIVALLTLTVLVGIACDPSAQEAAVAKVLASSYWVSAPIDGIDLANAYTPVHWDGLQRNGGVWERYVQTSKEPEVIDAAVRASPGPGYALRLPIPLRREVVTPAGFPTRVLFSGGTQLCGGRDLIVLFDYWDVTTGGPVGAPTARPDGGKWLVHVTIDRYEPSGDPTCLGTPLPAR